MKENRILVNEPTEMEFFSIKQERDKKYVHIWGYTYKADESGEKDWREVELCGCEVEINEFIENYKKDGIDYINYLYSDSNCYIGNYSGSAIVEIINNYYCGKSAIKSHYDLISPNMACGGYGFKLQTT